MITEEDALARFKEMTKSDNVVIIRHSNNDPVFGNSHKVDFELEVDGKRVSAVCESDTFSEMVCRLYYEPEE